MSNIIAENNVLYLVPLIVAITIILFTMLFSQRMKHEKIFEDETSNFLHGLSYLKPFIWFVNPDEEDPKVRRAQVTINKAGLSTRLNYRALTSLQILMLIGMVFLYGILFISLEAWIVLFGFLFNVPVVITPDEINNIRMLLAVGLLFAMMVPQMYIRMRAKRNEFLFTQDLPLMVLSVILMLRARKPVSDIFFDLSRTDNRYKEIFQRAYRMFVRDKQESYYYLYKQFDGTGFETGIEVLEKMGEYKKDESIQVLENLLQELIRTGQEKKRGKALLGNLASQFSMLLPFGGVILLGAVPIIYYAFSLLSAGTPS